MRKLGWFVCGFAAACALGVYVVTASWLLPLSLFAMIGAVVCCFLKFSVKKYAGLILIGMSAAFLWMLLYDTLYLSYAREADGQSLDTTVEITDYSERTDYGTSAAGRITIDGRRFRIYLYFHDEILLSPGDKLDGAIDLRFTADESDGAANYHRSSGTFLLGSYKEEVEIIKASEVPAKYFPAKLRRQIIQILDNTFPNDTLSLARALLLGDTSLLSYKDNMNLSVSGIRHIVAVSGLHVSILFALIYAIFGFKRVGTPLVGIPLLIVFAALAGFSPSVVRACVMQGLVLLSLMLNKEYDPPTALAFAVLVLLGVNPMTIASVSLQLSAGCMIGILGLSGRIHDFLMHEKRFGPAKGKSLKSRLIRWFVGSVSVTLGAMVVTTPLCALYFGTVSLIGILTNLLTLWAVTWLFCGIVVACIAGAVWLPLGQVIAWVVSWIARYVMGVASLFGSIPMAAVYTESDYIVIWLVLCYALIGVFLLTKQKRVLWLGGTMIGGLVIAVLLSWAEPRLDSYRVTVFDVGQGQCILFQTQRKTYLVDCGGDGSAQVADMVSQTLLSQGISHLDGVILTHFDRDHAGEVSDLLSWIPAKQIFLPDIDRGNLLRTELEDTYADTIQWVYNEVRIPTEEGHITLFPGEDKTSDNECGLCILFQVENCDILITGDRNTSGERALLKKTQLPDLEVLIVGHHGSASSTGIELLHATYPEIAVVSVGSGNRYGHPTEEVLHRLQKFGCQVLRTDEMGTIILRG